MGFYKCKIGWSWSLVLTVILVLVPRYWELRSESQMHAAASIPSFPSLHVTEGTIQKNTTLVTTLVDSNVPVAVANDIAGLIRPIFDVRKLRMGNLFRLEKENDGTLRKFEYKIDDETVLKVEKNAETYAAKVEAIDLDTQESVVTAQINNSLFAALDGYPKGDLLAIDLAGIFASDVDFNSDIQKGDQIRLVVDEQFHDGKFVKYGRIQAAELVNSGRTWRAFLFNGSYYDEKGNASKRSFLKSPLKFTRISSGFTSRRMHPILGVERAHLAVDYAAPTGTPVQAVANGVVTFAGWNDGYGNLVLIRHSGGLTSGYGHLSHIAPGVRAGQPIKQEELVGNVGQTGLATGPHLHFMMTRGGKAINPLSMKSEPAVPLDQKLRSQFVAHIAGWQEKLSRNVQTASR